MTRCRFARAALRCRRACAAAALVTAVVAILPAYSARAEVRVTGTAEAVRIEARDATVADVLSALGAGVGLQYRSGAPLERQVSGTFAGSLRRVLARVLEGYDFVLKERSGTPEVVIIGAAKTGESHAVTRRGRRAD